VPTAWERLREAYSNQTFSGDGRPKLGEGRSPGQREDATDEPGNKGDARRRHVGVDASCRGEDAAADDDADDNGKGVEGAEVLGEGAAGAGLALVRVHAMASVINGAVGGPWRRRICEERHLGLIVGLQVLWHLPVFVAHSRQRAQNSESEGARG